jgi:hypothetical protein
VNKLYPMMLMYEYMMALDFMSSFLKSPLEKMRLHLQRQ